MIAGAGDQHQQKYISQFNYLYKLGTWLIEVEISKKKVEKSGKSENK